MNNKDVIKKLCKLAQLDVDAVEAYEQAIKNIDIAIIKTNLSRFRDDHKQHIKDLNQLIVSFGGEAVKETADLKGLLLEGFTALRSMTGTEGALKAMKGNEKLTNKTYDDALQADELPENARLLLIKNRDDERRHLAYIEQVLADEPWKLERA